MAVTQTKSRSTARKSPPDMAKAATKAAAKPAKAAPARKKAAPVAASTPVITPQEWHQMVALGAYLRAEARGFTGGSPEQDWLDAEAELMAKFGGKIPTA
jgi:hypothetical protein